jgi:predicted ArsR family transcriptional regulator
VDEDRGASQAPPSAAPAAVEHQESTKRSNWEGITTQLRSGGKSVAELADTTGLTARQVQYALQQMREAGLVTLVGNRGRHESHYELRT